MTRARTHRRLALLPLLILLSLPLPIHAADVFVRFKVLEPAADKFRVTLDGHRHAGDPWYFDKQTADLPAAGRWSDWIDVSHWPWHAKLSRAGGVAEWPSMRVAIEPVGEEPKTRGCLIQVQLADKPAEQSVVHTFTERGSRNRILFLVPTPLREHAKEFETGAQMTARHLAWAKEAVTSARKQTDRDPLALPKNQTRLKHLDIITSIWGHYDPALAKQTLETLRLLGFNVVNANPGLDPLDIRDAGFRIYQQQWLYESHPKHADEKWNEFVDRRLRKNLQTEEGRWEFKDGVTHWVLSDEVRTASLMGVNVDELNRWFRDYLRANGLTDVDLGVPIDQVRFPADEMHGVKSLPRDADLPKRKILYHAAKFGQWWSAKQLRHSTELIHATLPGSKTETLPTDHGFFNAWGPPMIGMSWNLLDLFELGAQRSVDQLSTEDWLGLNHMYGPSYTWTGAHSFAYLNAIMRSAIENASPSRTAVERRSGSPEAQPEMLLRALITPSDDKYLRLKAYSALAQGTKSFFFWTFGPTAIGTENYWSDLRSMYDGLAKFTRALEQSEEVLIEATPVRDPVAILYSVSHDLWLPDDPAAFVEKRLTWHALRHLHVQPDFLREEDVEAGTLDDYKVLYITDWCVSRKATAAIDAWVKNGGILYLACAAATRDEHFEPHRPAFAANIYPEDATKRLVTERHSYNERTSLPILKPITTANVQLETTTFTLPVLGCRAPLSPHAPTSPLPHPTIIARFTDDNSPAAMITPHGKGTVIALAFNPMLAYARLANFQPTTLEERWPPEPRALIQLPLTLARLTPVAAASHPVVETSLLTGPKGSVLTLANYTYRPIQDLQIELKLNHPVARATSTEGAPLNIERTPAGVRLTLPLDWTDLVLLHPPER